MSGRRQQTAREGTGGAQDTSGVWKTARSDSLVRNRRDPPRRPTSGEGGAYKPEAKGYRAERESEGFVVPRMTVIRTPTEGRDPALVALADGGKYEGMVARPNNPVDEVREPRSELCTVAEHRGGSAAFARPEWIHGVTSRRMRYAAAKPEVCMRRGKTIGKPCAGNPHARFERGPQETGRRRRGA
jgi:hypothetical protein